jgi:hypothetical protein
VLTEGSNWSCGRAENLWLHVKELAWWCGVLWRSLEKWKPPTGRSGKESDDV